MNRQTFLLTTIKNAGKLILDFQENISSEGVYFKSEQDVVTEIDLKCEAYMGY